MYADKIVKIIGKTVDALNYQSEGVNPPFEKPRKALIVLPGFIGDAVLLTPFIRNLRYNLTNEIKIDTVCNKNIRNLIETLPYINDIYSNNTIQNRGDFLKNNEYDTVFLFNIPLLWAIAGYQAKIKQRISFGLERIGINYPIIWENLITHFVKSTPINDKKPQWKVYLETLNDLGMKTYDEKIEIRLTPDDLYLAKSILEKVDMPRISVHVTAGSTGKHWHLNNWIKIIKYLKEKYNCSFIATGIEKDREVYKYLGQQTGAKFLNLCGKTSIRETIALYQYIDLVITLDTSAAHLAAAANTRNIIVIYGPTNEAQWIPQSDHSHIRQIHLDLPCRPCITRICSNKKCLQQLDASLVIDALENISLVDN